LVLVSVLVFGDAVVLVLVLVLVLVSPKFVGAVLEPRNPSALRGPSRPP
jgi:hypothetical protein